MEKLEINEFEDVDLEEEELEDVDPIDEELEDVESNFSLEDAIVESSNMPTMYGVSMFAYYWDRVQRACLMLDPYNFTGTADSREKEFVYKNEDRFVKLPTFTSSDIFELMVTFAEEQDDRLSQALDAQHPMSSFNDVAQKLGLYNAWQKYRNDYLREFYLKWCKRHDIEPDFSF